MGETASLLEAQGVVKRYGTVTALDGVDLRIRAGECVALVGESGSGKTTLLRCFNRMVDPDSGAVRVRGKDARALDPVELRRRSGYVPQEGGLLPHWTVLRNAALVPWLQGLPAPLDLAAEALRRVGLPATEYGRRWPAELSGGQRQRVAIARALAARPDVILMDEPFGALDAITRADVREAFQVLRGELGLTALIVTHDLHEAAVLADRVAVLLEGRVQQVAPPRELAASPANAYVESLLTRAGIATGSAPGRVAR